MATQIPEPPIARFLFADTRMAWMWLIIRLYVGYQWLTAGLEKLMGYSFTFDAFAKPTGFGPWVFGARDGAAIKGFVAGAKEAVVVTLPLAYQVAWQGGSRFRPWSECSVDG